MLTDHAPSMEHSVNARGTIDKFCSIYTLRTNNRTRRYFSNRTNKTGKYYFINYKIQDTELRVIDQSGAQLGVLSKEEALEKAQMDGYDLVLIAPKARPPVAKITDFKKFLYEQEKKQKEAKKGAKKSVVKDIKLSLFISAHDLERFQKKTQEFLDEGHQVRINMTLRGREIIKKQMAFDLMNSFIQSLVEVNVSKEPRLEGRVVRAVISRKK